MSGEEGTEQKYESIEIKQELSDWLRSTEGLRELSHSWKSALYSLKKSGYFTNERDWGEAKRLQRMYRELKEGSYIAGLSFLHFSDLSKMYDEKLYVEDEESGEYHLQDVERFVGTEHFKVVVHLAFGFQNSVVDHFYS